jgi:hypothetical protein
MRERNKNKKFVVIILILGVLFNAPFVLAKNENMNHESRNMNHESRNTNHESGEVQVIDTGDLTIIKFQGKEAELARLSWGVTVDYEAGRIQENLASHSHEFMISDLVPGLVYYYQIDAVTEQGGVNAYYGSFVSGQVNENKFLSLNDFRFTQNEKVLPIVSGMIEVSAGMETRVSIDAEKVQQEVASGVITFFDKQAKAVSTQQLVKTGTEFTGTIPAFSQEQELDFIITLNDQHSQPVQQTSGRLVVEKLDQIAPHNFDMLNVISDTQIMEQSVGNYLITQAVKKVIKFGNEHGDDA